MNSNFEQLMSKKTDAQLLKIVTGNAQEYQAEAFEAAQREFARREISSEKIEVAKAENDKEQEFLVNKQNEPLDVIWKILSFAFPGILQLLISGALTSQGYDRKSSELSRWTLYGFGFYISAVLLIVFLAS
jgi:uncharacterized membrane protein (DUF106 family)